MDEFDRLRKYISQFVNITDEDWYRHQSMLTRRFIKKGEFILRAGEVCNHVTFLNKGYVRVYSVIDGEELTTNFAFENNYITDYPSLVSRQPADGNIVALEDAEILQLRYDHLQEIYESSWVWQKFGRLMAENILMYVVHRNRSMLLHTSEERYLNLMKERPKVFERIPQQYIASYLGIKPESLSRIRKRLSEKGDKV